MNALATPENGTCDKNTWTQAEHGKQHYSIDRTPTQGLGRATYWTTLQGKKAKKKKKLPNDATRFLVLDRQMECFRDYIFQDL